MMPALSGTASKTARNAPITRGRFVSVLPG